VKYKPTALKLRGQDKRVTELEVRRQCLHTRISSEWDLHIKNDFVPENERTKLKKGEAEGDCRRNGGYVCLGGRGKPCLKQCANTSNSSSLSSSVNNPKVQVTH